MRQRIALGGVGVAAVLGLLVLWGGIVAEPLSAMEKMAENIRKAKSYKYTMIAKTSNVAEPSAPPIVIEYAGTEYWVAPDLVRREITHSSTWKGPGPERTSIFPGKNKPWIEINNRTKTFRFRPPHVRDPLIEQRLEDLAKFYGEADRQLGTKEINGKKARGFVVDYKKIDRNSPFSAMVEIWLDSESNLPVVVRFDMKMERGFATAEMSDIQWDIDLDPKLFDPALPEGYQGEATPKSAALEGITEALGIYAEVSGGHYPPTKSLPSPSDIESFKKLGRLYKAARDEKLKEGKPFPDSKRGKMVQGFVLFADVVQRNNRDPAYYGKTVGPGDKDKVLLRWKLDDGRYEVIFGDLRSETVTAERLRALEGK